MRIFELFPEIYEMPLEELAKEIFNPPAIEVGDDVLTGRFLNKKSKITGFSTDKNGQPVIKTTKGSSKLFKPRFPKLMGTKPKTT